MKTFHYNLKIVVGLIAAVLVGLVFWFKLSEPVIKFEAEKPLLPPSTTPQFDTIKFAPGVLPDLILADSEGIKHLAYDPKTKKYDIKNSLNLEVFAIAVSKDDRHVENLYISTANGILRLDSDLEIINEGLGGSVPAALEASGEYVFATADGKFYTLDKNLKKLGEVTLLEQGFKDAHNILLYKNFAYLLDNVVNPIYLFKVDVGNLRQPKILKEIELFGINYHLQNQWLDPEKNRWVIVENSTSMMGQGQGLLVYNMETSKELNVDSNYFKKFNDYPDKIERESFGTNILAALESSPIWAVGEKLDQKYYVFEIRLGNDKPEFTNIIDLKLEADSSLAHANLQKAGNFLIITLDKTLIVVDLEKKRVVLHQILSSQVSDMTLISRDETLE